VPLKPGDQVIPNSTVLARIQPVEPGPLDAREYAQAQAEIRSLQAQLAAARSRVSEARAEQILAEREFSRTAELAGRGFVSQANIDRAQMARDRSRAASAQASQTVQATAQSLKAAQAALLVAGSKAKGAGAVSVTSPVAGFVLRVPQESERVVVAGTALVEVGDPEKLEIVTDLLSADAVRVRPGVDVLVEDWGGERPLKGRVRLIEPYGFTKISALGVEEQRVNVIIDFAEPRGAWQRMGHGYRATVRIVISAAENVLKVPISALFRTGRAWSVFVVDPHGRARLRRVEAGRMNDEEAEIVRGLVVGERVILHPSDKVADGVRVSQRPPAG
jgi:HlyD family secretion protein